MAATKTLPGTTALPITTDDIVFPFETGPIAKISESVPTESVDIDITNLAIQEVLPSSEFELVVIAEDKNPIEKALGRLVGGEAFVYEPEERRGVEGFFYLKITSFIGPLHPLSFAKALQQINRRVTIYYNDNPVTVF